MSSKDAFDDLSFSDWKEGEVVLPGTETTLECLRKTVQGGKETRIIIHASTPYHLTLYMMFLRHVREKQQEDLFIGFDVEKYENKVQTIQFAMQDENISYEIVCSLPEMTTSGSIVEDTLPLPIIQIFSDYRNGFVGNGAPNDVYDTIWPLNIPLKQFPTVIDFQPLLKLIKPQVSFVSTKLWSLGAEILHIKADETVKGKFQKRDWREPLDHDALIYAANDAWVAQRVCAKFFRKLVIPKEVTEEKKECKTAI
jgi:hypothetical protein